MPTPEFIDGGLKIVAAATVLARDGDERTLKAAPALSGCFAVPQDTLDLLGEIIEGHPIEPEALEARLAAFEARDDIVRMHAGNAVETGIEAHALGRSRKAIKGGALLPRIASGKVSLAPSLRRTVMYHANEVHRGGAREVVKLFKECATLNDHVEALRFEAGLLDGAAGS